MKSVYIDKDDLLAFVGSNETVAIGYSYEWEGEDVAHIHLNKLDHSFGQVGKAVWIKDDDITEQQQCQFLLHIKSESEVQVFTGNGDACDANFIPSQSEMYSRAKGILEVDVLKDKRVMIIGLGSFGSQIAIELAKAGVGEFALFDFDRVELHNLARHTCTIKDLGRLKTDAIKEAILGKNKLAKVDLFPIDINQ